MALLMSAMRAGAMTRDPAWVRSWFEGRQAGWWVMQHRRPTASVAPARDPDELRRALSDLHRQGVIDDAELERLRARLGA